MAPAINVERDTQGVQTALRELFEEAYHRESNGGLPDDVDEHTRDRAQGDLPSRSLSPGYYSRAEYLLDLGAAMECGAQYSADMLSREDVRGLQALKQAKNEFERDHPQCPSCGTRQDNRWAFECRSCHTKFAGRGN